MTVSLLNAFARASKGNQHTHRDGRANEASKRFKAPYGFRPAKQAEPEVKSPPPARQAQKKEHQQKLPGQSDPLTMALNDLVVDCKRSLPSLPPSLYSVQTQTLDVQGLILLTQMRQHTVLQQQLAEATRILAEALMKLVALLQSAPRWEPVAGTAVSAARAAAPSSEHED
jgi:hypothetical protein